MWRCVLLMLLSSVMCFFGCTTPKKVQLEKAWLEESGKVKVLTTTGMIEDLVARVGGEQIATLSLIVGDLDPHSYELVKGDDEKFQVADIVFYNGLGLEHGLSVKRKLQAHPQSVALGDRVCERVSTAALLVDGQQDPHIWMDVSLWAETVPVIVEELSRYAPEHASVFAQRGALLQQELRAIDLELLNVMHTIPDSKRYLVTSHDAFNYFARRYLNTPGHNDWEERFQAPEGLAPEAQLSVKDLGVILTHIKNYDIATLFPESNVSGDSLRKLAFTCAHEGHAIRLCQTPLYGDTMPESGSYAEMMLHNGKTIAQELLYEK